MFSYFCQLIAMKNSEFEEIFAPLDVLGDYSGNFIELFNKKIELQKKYFLKNFRKDKDLKIKVFEKFGYSYLLGNKDNLEALDKILDNPNFIKLFEKSDLYLDGICKIILVYSNSSEYFLENLALEHKKNEKKCEQFQAYGSSLFLYNTKTKKIKNLTEMAFMNAGDQDKFIKAFNKNMDAFQKS